MKRLLTLFSVFVLGFGSSFEVASCTARPKHESDDNDDLDHNQNFEILNQIKKEEKQTLSTGWQTKETININDYPEQIGGFEELVAELKTKNDGLTLTTTAISKYRFLNQLLVGFKVEFANLNQHLQDRYSNYYVDSMPLFLAEDNISFTLYHINFDNIAKLLVETPQAVLGITVQVNIGYEIRFKGLSPVQDNIASVIAITNNLDVLRNMQDNLEKYFVDFVNDIFEKQDFNITLLGTNPNQFWFVKNDLNNVIETNLSAKNLLFKNLDSISYKDSYISYKFNHISREKSISSVLAGAGEGYDSTKLTAENFLEFYKKINPIPGKVYGEYYNQGTVNQLVMSKLFMIENLPFKESTIPFKKGITILRDKNQVDAELLEFSKLVMNFWHYY